VEKTVHERARTEAQALIASGAWKRKQFKEQFAQRVSTLSRAEKQALYDELRQKPPFGYAALNLIPILSMGSWRQGDVLGGTVPMLAFFGGLTLDGYRYWTSGTGYANATMDTLAWVSTGIASAGYLFSLVQPFLRSASDNQALREALGLDLRKPKAKEKGGRS
jgi:hypothetical protein